MSGMRRAFTEVFAFGRSNNAKGHSKVEQRLAQCLPAADWVVYNDTGELEGFSGWHVFGSQTARNHFIKHALILLSENGRDDLSTLHFYNFFARSYDKAGVIWYTASIVAIAPGGYRVRHSIVATRAGTTKTAALQLLVLDVETKLDAVLRGNGITSGGFPAKDGKRKDSARAVSIISTLSEAMAAPNAEAGDHLGTQKSSTSQYYQASHLPDTTRASVQVGPGPSSVSYRSVQASSTPVSPMDDDGKRMQPLHVDADMPNPLHFEKPIARMPVRLPTQQTEFKIYVGEEV